MLVLVLVLVLRMIMRAVHIVKIRVPRAIIIGISMLVGTVRIMGKVVGLLLVVLVVMQLLLVILVVVQLLVVVLLVVVIVVHHHTGAVHSRARRRGRHCTVRLQAHGIIAAVPVILHLQLQR